MAEELGVEVSEVVEGGTALAFVAYPTAITKAISLATEVQNLYNTVQNLYKKVQNLHKAVQIYRT